MKKPNILYRYDCFSSGTKKVTKHKITKECCPYIEIDYFKNPHQGLGGDLWRCQCSGDHYGYASLEEAKKEEILNTKQRIYEDQCWLKKLTEG